jgi:hypothetical protein
MEKTESNMSNNHPGVGLNGMQVVARRGNTIFIRLPDALQRPIDGGCHCGYCKANPDKTPKWDALAVAADKEHVDQPNTTWTVHMPEGRGY